MKRYETWTLEALLRRIGHYADYIGCGCYGKPDGDEKCRNEKNTCARADFKSLVSNAKRANKEPRR